MNWIALNDNNQLDEIDEISKNKAVIIFKHSTSCSISATSLGRFERQFNAEKAGGAQFFFLDLLRYRPVSNAIAERYVVRHESPQILVIENGACTYNASHYDISFNEVVEMV